MPRKYPFDKLVLFLLLARNSYKAISAYLKNMSMGDFNGQMMVSYETYIRSVASAKEKGLLTATAPVPKRKGGKKSQVTETSIDIVAKIPFKFKNVAKKAGVVGNPYENENIRIILSSPITRRAIEVYLTSKIKPVEIAKLVNDKFRMNFTEDDIAEYKEWVYNIDGLIPEQVLDYFDELPREERSYKNMAYMSKEDYVRWKMQDDCDIDAQRSAEKIMSQSMMSLEELFKSKERISHNAVKIWSDIFFKSSEHIQKLKESGTSNEITIFKEVRLVLDNSPDEEEVIPFTALEDLEDDEDDDEQIDE